MKKLFIQQILLTLLTTLAVACLCYFLMLEKNVTHLQQLNNNIQDLTQRQQAQIHRQKIQRRLHKKITRLQKQHQTLLAKLNKPFSISLLTRQITALCRSFNIKLIALQPDTKQQHYKKLAMTGESVTLQLTGRFQALQQLLVAFNKAWWLTKIKAVTFSKNQSLQMQLHLEIYHA